MPAYSKGKLWKCSHVVLSSRIMQYHAYRKYTRNSWVRDTWGPNGIRFRGVPLYCLIVKRALNQRHHIIPVYGRHHSWKYHAKAYIPYMGSDIVPVVSYVSGYHNMVQFNQEQLPAKWKSCCRAIVLSLVSRPFCKWSQLGVRTRLYCLDTAMYICIHKVYYHTSNSR